MDENHRIRINNVKRGLVEYEKDMFIAIQHGLKDHGQCLGDSEQIFTHLECKDGTQFEFVKPLSERDILLAALVNNRLLVKIYSPGMGLRASEVIFTTDGILAYHDQLDWSLASIFGQDPPPYPGPVVVTEKTWYRLVTAPQ